MIVMTGGQLNDTGAGIVHYVHWTAGLSVNQIATSLAVYLLVLIVLLLISSKTR